MKTANVLAALAFAGCRALLAQPLGAEFQVNTFSTSFQESPRVATNDSGLFVVVWASSGQDGNGYGIFGRRFDSAGIPRGGEFQVNTYTTGLQSRPAVAMDGAGGFVVVWTSLNQGSTGEHVFLQRYASDGARRGAELLVDSAPGVFNRAPDVASGAAGDFVVVWANAGGDGSSYGILGQRFASAGAPLGGTFIVNPTTGGGQYYPRVSTNTAGDFAVVWLGPDSGSYGVLGQLYSSAGARQGAEFAVNTYTTGAQGRAAVARTPGGAVVIFQNTGEDGDNLGVFARRFDLAGAALDAPFRVNTYTTNIQSNAAVAGDAAGGFVVVWNGVGPSGSAFDVFARRYLSSGTPVDPVETLVNVQATGSQSLPGAARDASGTFVVAWVSSSNQDGDKDGIFGRRLPCETLTVDSVRLTGPDAVCPTSPGGLGGTLMVNTTFGGALSYQWWFYPIANPMMGMPISGAIADSYTIAIASFPGNGVYGVFCRVSPQCGAVIDSSAVFVTVGADGQGPGVVAPSAAVVRQSLCQ